MKKKRTIIILIILFIFVTITKYKQNEILTYLIGREINNIEVEDKDGYYKNTSENEGLKPEYNVENIKEARIEDYVANIGKFNNVKYDGRISIPAIYLKLPIFEGINETHLLLGAAEQLPRNIVTVGSPGNYILASHKMSNKKNLGFARINRLKPGQLIYATDENNLYIYKIYLSKTVKNNETEYINEQPKDKSIITLYTCSKFGKNSDKVIVQGELTETKPLNQLSKEEKDIMFKKK